MGIIEFFDHNITIWLDSNKTNFPLINLFVKYFVGDYLTPVILSLMLYSSWFNLSCQNDRINQQIIVIASIIGVAVGNLITLILNLYIFRPRPFEDLELHLLFYQPSDSSFPANPTVVGFALALGLLKWNKIAGFMGMFLAFAWGFSRVYAGVSYTSDVVAGAIIGILATSFSIVCASKFNYYPKKIIKLARRIYLA